LNYLNSIRFSKTVVILALQVQVISLHKDSEVGAISNVLIGNRFHRTLRISVLKPLFK